MASLCSEMKATSGRGLEALACCPPCPPASPPLSGSPLALSLATWVPAVPLMCHSPLASLRACARCSLHCDTCSTGRHPLGMSLPKCYLLKDTLPFQLGALHRTLAVSQISSVRLIHLYERGARRCGPWLPLSRHTPCPNLQSTHKTRNRNKCRLSPHCVSGTPLSSSKGRLTRSSELVHGLAVGKAEGAGPPCTLVEGMALRDMGST